MLDEGHKIKNDLSLVSKALQGLHAEYRLILTGTPLQNNLSELWALLHWLYPEVFTVITSELFKQSFDLGKGLFSNSVLDNSRKLLELVMLRRMKDSPGVDLNLPPKTEVLLYVPLSPMQRFWYTRLVTKMDQGLLDDLFKNAKEKEMEALTNHDEMGLSKPEQDSALLEKDGASLNSLNNAAVERPSSTSTAHSPGVDAFDESRSILKSTIAREAEAESSAPTSAWRKLMNLLMQLRKVCNHPYQIANAEPDPYWLGEHTVTASGKFIVLDKLIHELVIKQRKKILIFSGFTRMLDLVEDLLLLRGGDGTAFRYSRLDGSTPRARRNLGIRMFNMTNSEQRVMLISTRAGGLGINLASASDVVLLDQDWNPQITLQAESRAHRIGQKNPVTIYKLVSQGTVEEQMMGRIMKKLYLSAKVTESMEDIHTPAGAAKRKKSRPGRVAAEEEGPQLSTSQLMTLVRRGTQAISRPDIDIKEMVSWYVVLPCLEYNSSRLTRSVATLTAIHTDIHSPGTGKLHSRNAKTNRPTLSSKKRRVRRPKLSTQRPSVPGYPRWRKLKPPSLRASNSLAGTSPLPISRRSGAKSRAPTVVSAKTQPSWLMGSRSIRRVWGAVHGRPCLPWQARIHVWPSPNVRRRSRSITKNTARCATTAESCTFV